MKILGDPIALDSFLKACKISETKNSPPTSGLTTQTNLISQIATVWKFFSKLRNNNPVDKEIKYHEKLIKSRLDEQQPLKKLQIKTLLPSG